MESARSRNPQRIEPSWQELKVASDYFKTIGGNYYSFTDDVTGDVVHSFRVPTRRWPRISDVVPDIHFSFGLGNFDYAATDAHLEGIDKYTMLSHLDLSESRVSDDGITCLLHLPNLVWLDLSMTPVSTRGLSVLCQIKTLSSLFLDYSGPINSDGIKELATLLNLAELDISNHHVSEDVVDALSLLKALGILRLSTYELSEEGVKKLNTLKNLQILRLSGPVPTETQIDHLCGLENVGIRFDAYKMSDCGMQRLARMRNLRSLWVIAGSKSRITDVGLQELASLQGLESLNVGCAGVTANGIRSLEAALPHCRIEWSGDAAQ